MEQTAVEWLYNKMLYIDNEYDMKLITKNEYQFKRRDIIEQAKEIEKQQRKKDFLAGNNCACMEHENIEDYFNKYIKSE